MTSREDPLQQAIDFLEQQEALSPDERDVNQILGALFQIRQLAAGPTITGPEGTTDPHSPTTYQTWVKRVSAMLTESLREPVSVEEVEATLQQTERGSNSAGEQLLGDPGGTLAAPPPIPEGEQDLGPSPIGVERDFTAQRLRQPGEPGTFRANQFDEVEPRYFEDDEFLPQTSAPSQIRSLQNRLVRAGLLEEDSFWPGFWDEPSAKALRQAMAFANRGGEEVQTTLSRLATVPRPAEEEEDRPPAVLPPDPASIAQDVESTVRQRLGRDPTDAERKFLAAKLAGFHAAAVDQANALAAGELVDPSVVDPADRGTLQRGGVEFTPSTQINPADRFLQLFEEKFRPEMERNQRVADTARSRQNVMQSLLSLQTQVTR